MCPIVVVASRAAVAGCSRGSSRWRGWPPCVTASPFLSPSLGRDPPSSIQEPAPPTVGFWPFSSCFPGSPGTRTLRDGARSSLASRAAFCTWLTTDPDSMRTGRLGWKPRWDRGPVEAGSYTGLLPLGSLARRRTVVPRREPTEAASAETSVSALHSRGLWTSAVSDWPAPSTPRLAGDLPAPAPSPIRPSDNRSPAARLQGHLTGIPEPQRPRRAVPKSLSRRKCGA
ncbi:uncharacterized protein LOC132007388 [Mustela nigripes]|uniref:uncharacterized protein LOC132007388 n=1 Tax=Mustela nigripes TaxID=77151 RepID=UPI002814EEDB|nr:uncharacterized protein LOC132007388 [Mustela nigripes]